MANYQELYNQSVQYLDKHPELLALDEPLIQNHLKNNKDSELLQLAIPSKLTSMINKEYEEARYLVLKVSRKVCEILKIKAYDVTATHTNIIIKAEKFDEILKFSEEIARYENVEPLENIKVKKLNRIEKIKSQVAGKLPDFLEEQVLAFANSKDREYFINKAVKDVRKDFLEYSILNKGNRAYTDRRLKNIRLNEIVREKFNLEVEPRSMKDSDDLMTYKCSHNHIGKYSEYYVEV